MAYESRCCERFPYRSATRYAYNFDLHEQARSKYWIEIDLSIQARFSTFQYPRSMGVAIGCCRKDEKTMQILTIGERKKSRSFLQFFYVRATTKDIVVEDDRRQPRSFLSTLLRRTMKLMQIEKRIGNFTIDAFPFYISEILGKFYVPQRVAKG